jgi:hypothetical protein
MKLKNLLEELFPIQLNTTNTNRTLQDKPMAQGDVGTGTYSSVSAKKNDPFLVRKTSDTLKVHNMMQKNRMVIGRILKAS